MPIQLSGSLVITGSITTTGGITISGSILSASYAATSSFSNNFTVLGNLTVFGTQSVQYITSSQLNVANNVITVNVASPGVRYGGLSVFDSGSQSSSATASLFWDSQNNNWIYQRESGSTYNGGMLISGPRNFAGIGNEQGTTSGSLMKGQGGDHMTSSAIFEDGYNATFYGTSLVVSSSGLVGIGTSLPAYSLDVAGTGRFTGAVTLSSTTTLSTITAGSILFAGTSGLISQNNGNLFYDNANTRLGINVGSSPAYTLSVGGTGNFTGALTGTSLALSTFLSVNNGTAGTSYIQFNYNPVDARCKSWRLWNDQDQYGDFAIAQATTQGGSTYSPKFLITTAGNIGMGTATPNGPLDIVGTTYDGKYTISLVDSAAVAADIGGGIYFGGNYTGTTKTGWAGIVGKKDNATGGEYGGYMAFYTRTHGSAPAERMRIGSDGKVGIGLTTWYQPYTKLIVGGAIAYNNNTDGAVADNSYGQSFAKKINIVAGSGANTIYGAAGSEAALYVVTGLNLTNSSRFADIILYLGAGSTAPIVISSQTYSTAVTRTYANAGENLTLSLTGNSNTYTIRMTGMGANERT